MPELYERELHSACRDLATSIHHQFEDPVDFEEIVTTEEVGDATREFLETSLKHARTLHESGHDPNAIARMVRHISIEMAAPPMRGDRGWLNEALSVLCGLLFPSTLPNEHTLALLVELENRARRYRESFPGSE